MTESLDIDHEAASSSSSSSRQLERRIVAEKQLLRSLERPRIPQAKKPSKDSGKSIKTTDLAQFRQKKSDPDPDNDQDDDENAELIAQVRALSHTSAPGNISKSPASGYAKIKANAIDRRDRHDRAQQEYAASLKSISDILENQLLSTSDRVKVQLTQVDSTLREILVTRLSNAQYMVQQDQATVQRMWQECVHACESRRRCLDEFAQALENLEQTRVTRVGKSLETLTQTLITVAYVLGAEVERVVETEVYELNLVLISNRASHAELLARMLESDVQVRVTTRLSWEAGLEAWRHLRHDDALGKFQHMLQSQRFTDPTERQDLCEKMKLERLERHERERLPLLSSLEDSLSCEFITVTTISAISSQLETLAQVEETRNEAYFKQLRQVHEHKMVEAQACREHLRAELHSFGAKAPEGDFKVPVWVLQSTLQVSSPEMEDYFRQAGMLKTELVYLLDRMEHPQELMYDHELTLVRPRLCCLLSALDLSARLEAQGKSEDRRVIQSTLEKLRKASKSDFLSILTPLSYQCQLLANATGLDADFQLELSLITAKLEELIISASRPNTSTCRSGTPGGGTIDSGSSILPGASSTIHNSSSTIVEGSTKQSTTTSLGLEDCPFSIAEIQHIRRLQRRLAMLLNATDLPDDVKQTLVQALVELDKQASANAIVDAVVTDETTEILAVRNREGVAVLDRIGSTLERQSSCMHDQMMKLTTYYETLAKMQQEHASCSESIDHRATQLQYDLEDDFEIEDQDRARVFDSYQAELRHAPNAQVLESSFGACVNQLETIETGYRVYFEKGMLASKCYPQALAQEQNRYLTRLLEHFGLRTVTPLPFVVNSQACIDQLLSKDEINDKVEKLWKSRMSSSSAQMDEAVDDDKDTESSLDPHTPKEEEGQEQTPEQEAERFFQSTCKTQTFKIDMTMEELVENLFRPSSLDEEEQIINEPATSEGQEEEDVENNEENASEEQTTVESESTEEEQEEEMQAVDSKESTEEVQAKAQRVAQENTAEEAQVKESIGELTLDSRSIIGMVTSLRNEVLNRQCRDHARRLDFSAVEFEKHAKAFTLELEERLRYHWPRKGRLDVLMYQPRESELLAHRQRYERQIRAVEAKKIKQDHAFLKHVSDFELFVSDCASVQKKLRAQLPMQQTLAGLQGIEQRCKQALMDFQHKVRCQWDLLSTYLHEEPLHIQAAYDEMIQQYQLFPDLVSVDGHMNGCDYHPEEVQELTVLIEAQRAKVRDVVSTRTGVMDSLKAKESLVLEKASEIQSRFDQCLQNLSMKEGLGQKYGTPRRNAQERIRSEISRAETSGQEIHRSLENLRELMHDAQTTSGHSAIVQKQSSMPIFQRLRHVLLELRHQLYVRAGYFECWKPAYDPEIGVPCRPVKAFPIQSKAFASLQFSSTLDDPVLESAPLASSSGNRISFLKLISSICDQCKADTRALFEQEGKLDELPGAASVPESLERYLIEQLDKAKHFRDAQVLALQTQVANLQELIVDVPEIAMSNLMVFFDTFLEQESARVWASFQLQLSESLERKTRHENQLRPELGSLNHREELEALGRVEEERSLALVVLLEETQEQVVGHERLTRESFVECFVAQYRFFMTLFDSLIFPSDISFSEEEEGNQPQPQSVEEQEVDNPSRPTSTRKSLKRLRKAIRKEARHDERVIELPADAPAEECRFPKRQWPALACTEEEEGLDAETTVIISFVTSAHRSTVRARDELYARYQELYQARMTHTSVRFNDLMDKEKAWLKYWKHEIQSLTSSS